jgi:hypothetical protein
MSGIPYYPNLSPEEQIKLLLRKTGPSLRKAIIDGAWFCSRCKCLNGLAGKRGEIRKTCFKCAKPREKESACLLMFKEVVNRDSPDQVEPF